MNGPEPSKTNLPRPVPDHPPPMYSAQPMASVAPPPPYVIALNPTYCPPPYPQYPGNCPPYTVGYINGQSVVVTTQPVNDLPPSVPRAKSHTGYSVFTLLCCCLPIGIAALVFSMKTQNANIRGDTAKAKQYSHMAQLLNHVALTTGIAIAVVWIIIVIHLI
ncbi:dispanin subfamily A member 2b-like [Ambystoma mexicanum]|uniref:dispanin subfamily A member 2b-like n=1 Tax=Ambystoma mexicanum TaxID=8296 RepID=UPI0037E79237